MQDEKQQGQNVTHPGAVLGPSSETESPQSVIPSQTNAQVVQSGVAQQSVASSVELNPVMPNQASSPSPPQQQTQTEDMPQDQSSQAPKVDINAPHVEWTASEYMANPKSGGWFAILTLVSIIVAVLVYFITDDIISSVIMVVIGVMFGVFSARQPEILDYAIDNTGFHIGKKYYPYNSFKSFSVVHEGAMGSILLMPLKRFMPPLVIHYDPKDEDKIAETLSSYLPYEEHKPDIVDAIVRKIKF